MYSQYIPRLWRLLRRTDPDGTMPRSRAAARVRGWNHEPVPNARAFGLAARPLIVAAGVRASFAGLRRAFDLVDAYRRRARCARGALGGTPTPSVVGRLEAPRRPRSAS